MCLKTNIILLKWIELKNCKNATSFEQKPKKKQDCKEKLSSEIVSFPPFYPQ